MDGEDWHHDEAVTRKRHREEERSWHRWKQSRGQRTDRKYNSNEKNGNGTTTLNRRENLKWEPQEKHAKSSSLSAGIIQLSVTFSLEATSGLHWAAAALKHIIMGWSWAGGEPPFTTNMWTDEPNVKSRVVALQFVLQDKTISYEQRPQTHSAQSGETEPLENKVHGTITAYSCTKLQAFQVA